MAEKRKEIRFELLMDAGSGAQVSGDILVQALTCAGNHVFVESIIPSEISPPRRTNQALSGVVLRVADYDLGSIGDETDFILASHEVVLQSRLMASTGKKQRRILLDLADKSTHEESYEKICAQIKDYGFPLTPFEIPPESQSHIGAMNGKGKNIFYTGMISAILNLSKDEVAKVIRSYFKSKLSEDVLSRNDLLFDSGYQFAKEEVKFSFEIGRTLPKNKGRVLIDGGQALGLGIIDAGIKLCSGYPITPAFNVMQILAKEFLSYGGILYQAEDEIAAIGVALGASFAGVPSVTCTSGPGLSLKQEFIGYASAAEIPLVIIDAQRGGPSTGMPTKTEQSDLLAAIYGSHGDNTRVVVSVSDSTDCFYAPLLARYLAEKLRLPVFIMADFQIFNSYKSIPQPQVSEMNDPEEISDFILEHFFMERLPAQIEMVRSNSFKEAQVCRVTGLNTDELGSVNCSPAANERAHAIRNKKLHWVSRALKKPEMFGKEEGQLLVVGWGSSRGVLEEAITLCAQQGLPVSGMHFKVVYPLPDLLKELFLKFQRVETVEVAYGDSMKPAPLASLLRIHTGLPIGSLISSPTGCPIRAGDIVRKVKETLKG